MLGSQYNSVPDSCCLKESTQCGAGVFTLTEPRKLIEQIHTHGCITIMQRRLEDHVVVNIFFYRVLNHQLSDAFLQIILIVFSSVGGVLAVIQLLNIVLACCYANQISKFESCYDDYDPGAPAPAALHPGSRTPLRPGTPQMSRGGSYYNNNETSC